MTREMKQKLQVTPSHVGQLSNTQIDDLRARFLSAPRTTDLSALRPVIARSWQRSLACNVNADSSVWPSADPRTDEQLLIAAEPVLTDLESLCLDVGGSLVLTDADGTLAVYRGDAVQRRIAERFYPLIGAQMREDLVGTNSDGTALEEGRAVQVWGAEHLNEQLTNAYCTSAPIKDPIRRSIRGVLAVMLPESVAQAIDPRAVMMSVTGAAADITKRLADRLAASEQALMNEYLRETRKRGANAVLAMDDRTTIVSRSALKMLDQNDFAVLAAMARDTEQSDSPITSKLNVGDGGEVMVHARPMDLKALGAGSATVMRVHAESSKSRLPTTTRSVEPRMFDDVFGTSWTFKRALDAAATAVRRRMPSYILGEQGVGKLHLARAISGLISRESVVFDFSRQQLGTDAITSVDTQLASGSMVILHRLERAPASFREELSDLLSLLEQPALIITADAIRDELVPVLNLLRGIEVSIPPLRSRREDIATLAEAFARETFGEEIRFSPKLRDALVTADWSGNVAQLKELVRSVRLQRQTGGEIQMSDLTEVQLRALNRSRLTRLEEAELQQIRAALVESGGNRVQAATLLGIGRSTLYRKIDSYEGRGFDLVID